MTEVTDLTCKSSGIKIRNNSALAGTSILYLIFTLILVCIEIKDSLLDNGLSIINYSSVFIGVAGVIYSMFICLTLKSVKENFHSELIRQQQEAAATKENLKERVSLNSTKINEAAALVKKKAQKIEVGSKKVSDALSDISTNYSIQCEEIENTTISIVQLAQKLYDIMNHIGAVGTVSRQTKEICSSADDMISCLNNKTAESVITIETLKNKSTALNNSSEEIKSIMRVVKEINEKINILSINAAIEAARAGVAGKGFGVVASEIRNLADQTKASTKYIDEVVFKVQKDVNASIKLIDGTAMIILEQEAIVKDTERAFQNIVNHMENIVYQVGNINTSIIGINEYKDSATVSISSIAGSSLNNESQINDLLEEIDEHKVNASLLVDIANLSINLLNELEKTAFNKEDYNG